MEHEAIYALYSNAKKIVEQDGSYIVTDENGDEITIDISAVQTKATELQTAKDNEEQAKADLKTSAKAKLIAGEPLTEEEANTIVL